MSRLDSGELAFSVEGRVLRELGERLVRKPEVALLELIKNSYDADASKCTVQLSDDRVAIVDDGCGMSFDQFVAGWMRIGTAVKEGERASALYGRPMTGEKGIGRLAVRFLGRYLTLTTVAHDPDRRVTTRLVARFDWPEFDRHEDLGTIRVPYELETAEGVESGTALEVSQLRPTVRTLDLRSVRTGSLGMLSPLRSLLRSSPGSPLRRARVDPGFTLELPDTGAGAVEADVAREVLDAFVLRATVALENDRLALKVYRRGAKRASLSIIDTFENHIAPVYADIRFFPRRAGTFAGLSLDGRKAQKWISSNHGVAVFDRGFRVSPYGGAADDWLMLQADAARNRREPRSSLAERHFPMPDAIKKSTSLNWMLRLPQSAQLIGAVEVVGRQPRGADLPAGEVDTLLPAADREGYIANRAFDDLWHLIRGAVEALAYEDRNQQIEEERASEEARVARAREEAATAIAEISANPSIRDEDKRRIVSFLVRTQEAADRERDTLRERELKLQTMSLLGVVAGFMTHEFGAALQELRSAHRLVADLVPRHSELTRAAVALDAHIGQLREYARYAEGYVIGVQTLRVPPFAARPRILQVVRVFGVYAKERGIAVEVEVPGDLQGPDVPLSLYSGVALNLYTNAIKAILARRGEGPGRIRFWAGEDERWHRLEVSDTGVGVPSSLRERIFDPLFSTSAPGRSPLGSGMGLGLALVRRGLQPFGGEIEVVAPSSGFSTTISVRLPRRLGAGSG